MPPKGRKAPAKRKPAARSRKPPAKKPAPLKVVDGVKQDLAGIAKLDPKLATSGLAASALALARQIDNSRNSATSKSMCAKALNDTLERLRELAPAEKEKDGLDELSAKRERRIAGGAKA